MADGTHHSGVLIGESRLRAILDASPIGVSISNYYDGKIIYENESLSKIWGGPAEGLLGTDSIDYYHDPNDIRWVIEQLRQHHPVTGHEMVVRRIDGSTRWCEVNMVATWVDEVRVVLTWFKDISEIRKAREELKHMATHDSLTGLANRMRFNAFMTEAVARSRRLNNASSLLYLDLDGFKAVNDTYGHPMGDFLLQELARRLTSTVRETDFIARLGGDEFAVVIEALSDRTEPQLVGKKIMDALKMPFKRDGIEATVGVSIGISFFAPESMDIEVVSQHADSGMYRAKQGGKGRICVYDPSLDGSDNPPGA